MIGIYKIENKTNGKIYIGQSVDIERRFKEHCKPSCNSSQIDKAIKEQGKENFEFIVLEECKTEELNSKEDFQIQKYNSIVPYGYNVTEKNLQIHINYVSVDKEKLQAIYQDLKNTTFSFTELSRKYEVSISTISRINSGKVYKILPEDQYPIREKEEKKLSFCVDCGKQITLGCLRCRECNYKVVNKTEKPVTREELKELIRSLPFTTIGKKQKCNDNNIRKWCDFYKLPRTKREINSYSDEEWEKI